MVYKDKIKNRSCFQRDDHIPLLNRDQGRENVTFTKVYKEKAI